MKVVIQRVKNASVKINEKITTIAKGFVILAGFSKDDSMEDVDYIAKKVVGLRIFDDINGKMNLSIQDVKGDILIVSQFTLYANSRKGNRPSFDYTALPDKAKMFYENFIDKLKMTMPSLKTGEFGCHMEVQLINDGPVTIILDSKDKNNN